MNLKLRKVLSVLIVLAVATGWYITVFGAGSISSIKNVMKFGLDIDGGIYVVMEAKTDAKESKLKKIINQTHKIGRAHV